MSIKLNYPKLSPKAFETLLAFSQSVKSETLTRNLIDLINIRVSQLNECMFCIDMHSKEAKIHGERELRLYHLTAWRESPLFSEKEKAALAWAENLTRLTTHHDEDETFEKLRAHYSDQEISDLTFVVTTINAWNRLGRAFKSTPGSQDKIFGLDKAGLS